MKRKLTDLFFVEANCIVAVDEGVLDTSLCQSGFVRRQIAKSASALGH